MTTIINTPPSQSSDEGVGMGLIAGILIAAVLGILFFIYGLPMIWGGAEKQSDTQNIEIQIPAATPSVTTPEPAE